MGSEVIKGFSGLDVLALGWFTFCWLGYSVYSRKMSQRRTSLSSIMAAHRVAWMDGLLTRDNRVGDAALLGNLERNVSFFASSTLLVLAGLVAALGSGDDIVAVTDNLPFTMAVSEHGWETKLLLLAAIFVYAFFKFSWSLRQYGFAAVLIGRAPAHSDLDAEAARQFSTHAAQVISRAAQAFNLGLRAYYFSLAYLLWFLNPWIFMLASSIVVGVLYRREFRSRVLNALNQVV
ncbi:MAG: DUF599 domain-containing protein [Gammaproteobacteria bacterium]|nr:DUF599 domain-containing protein [Gammaproteobacteria bacterium]MBQ0840043.1 DUF599 domain-containing protein [Gammaproteobacteria bacterium]